MKTDFYLKRENDILKELLRVGFFWMNYCSTDCDGCSSESSNKYTSLEEFYEQEETSAEWADGPFRYDLALPDENGQYHLNERSSGGSWGDY